MLKPFINLEGFLFCVSLYGNQITNKYKDMKTQEYFNIKIGKIVLEIELSFDKSTFFLYVRHEIFSGSIGNGHYSYNGKGIVLYDMPKQFAFFEEDIKEKAVKILVKNKIIKK